jgi:c-di-GMP-binding flagellar brake protein YcgR
VHFEVSLYAGKQGNPIQATALDLSGGGMAVLADAQPPEGLLTVDPFFAGDFPLAGLRCHVAEQTSQGEGWRLGLEFVGLSLQQETELAQSVNTYQLHRAS